MPGKEVFKEVIFTTTARLCRGYGDPWIEATVDIHLTPVTDRDGYIKYGKGYVQEVRIVPGTEKEVEE